MIAPDAVPELRTRRLKLRKFKPEDVQMVWEIWSDAETVRYWSDVPLSEFKQAEALLQRELELSEKGGFVTWGIADPVSDELMGKFTLFNFSEINRRAEVGYILARRHWRNGYLSEVMERMLDFAFNELDLHRLEADTDPENVASLALLEKFGFQREGLFRERWWVDGRWCDSVMFGLIRNPAHSDS